MNVRNCRRCGRLFNYVMGHPICPNCKEELEEKFQEVKKYVQTHAQATIQMVTEECDVEAAQIQQWIREDRLQFTDDSPIKVPCEHCGAMIGSGRFCSKCSQEMANTLSKSIARPEPQKKEASKDPREKSRMRFLK